MFKSPKIFIMALLILFILPAVYIGSGSAADGDEKAAAAKSAPSPGFNSLSKFNITHRQSEKELFIDVRGSFKEGVDALIDDGRLIIKYKNPDGTTAEESYALPAPVNENGVRTEIRENHIALTAPLIAKNERNESAIKTKMDRMKKWHSLDRDIDSLFDMDNRFFSNDDVFGRNFFDDEFERINRHMRSMTRMHDDLLKQMQARGFGPSAGASSQCRISHKIDNGSVVVTIEGGRLDNLEFKVENDTFRVQNKVTGSSEESSENQLSRSSFQSAFAESFTLPAKVDSSKMRIDRTGGKITVTLPIVN